MKRTLLIVAVCFCVGQSFSESSSNGEIETSPLKIYSAGLGVGGFIPITDSLKEYSEGFGKLSFMNSFYFRDNLSFFLDINWFAPGLNFGTDLGVDFLMLTGDVKPFIGGGVGVHYFEKTDSFGDNIGPSATVHAGVGFELTEAVQIRIVAPYHVTLNKERDQVAGVQVALLFSNRFKNVKKLNYNN